MFGLGGIVRRDFLLGSLDGFLRGLNRLFHGLDSGVHSLDDRAHGLDGLVNGRCILGSLCCRDGRSFGILGIGKAVGDIGAASGVAAVADLGGRLFGLLDAKALTARSAVSAVKSSFALVRLLLLGGLQLLLAGVGVLGGLALCLRRSYSAFLASISASRSARSAALTASSASSWDLYFFLSR